MDTTAPLDSSEGISFPTAPRRTVPPALAARYEDITLVGEGGMGTVYRGRDPRLGRSVALKLIKGDDPALWQRFLQEAKAQARIQHAYVCRVYEAGQADGEPYIAMQYVDGHPLSQIERSLSLEQNVKIIAEIAAAVHEAHRLGLIRRDIKPGNILVEPQEDGTLKPYIMDFGLARQVQEEGQTATGALVGTLAYMSPEQANGDVRSMDRRSDVYSLGATLYEAVAGRPPFVAENHWQLLLKIGDGEAPALGQVKKGVPVDLETIVMKCLERDPSRRYDSAKALAEDLQRFLDGDAILAKRSSWGYSMASMLYERGESPLLWCDRAIASYMRAKELGHSLRGIAFSLSFLYTKCASYSLDTNGDPRESLKQAEYWANEAVKNAPKNSSGYSAKVHYAEKELDYAFRKSRDPAPILSEARSAAEQIIRLESLEDRAVASGWSVAVELKALRWAMKQGTANAAMFDATMNILKPYLSEGCAKAFSCELLARLHVLRAQWLYEKGKNVTSDVNQGLSYLDTDGRDKPKFHAIRGQLFLLRARTVKDQSARVAAAKRAKYEFDTAFGKNKLLRNEFGTEAEDAAKLIE